MILTEGSLLEKWISKTNDRICINKTFHLYYGKYIHNLYQCNTKVDHSKYLQ